MGATFNTLTVPLKDYDRAAVEEYFNAEQAQCRYENGHSYSGGIGMANGLKFTNELFKTADEAEAWLSDHAQKWEEALVVVTPEHWIIGAWCSS